MADVTDGDDPQARGVLADIDGPDAAAAAPAASASNDPPDLHPLRVDVRSAMGVDAGPWTVGPDADHGLDIRWLDRSRAVVRRTAGDPDASGIPGEPGEPGEPGGPREPGEPGEATLVLLGPTEPPSRSGVQRREIVVGGWRILLDVEPERRARLRERSRRGREDAAHAGPLEVRAIIPGRVVAVSVAEGDNIQVGQQLLVVEAMKMQNELRSPRAGTIERIAIAVGDTVEMARGANPATLLLVIR